MDNNDNDNLRTPWHIMAELGEFLPEVPVSVLTMVSTICIEPDFEKRLGFGFEFINALNDMKLVSLMAQAMSDDGPIFVTGIDDDNDNPPHPRFSNYGFRLDVSPDHGETEHGNIVLPDTVWVGAYNLDPQYQNFDPLALRCLLTYENLTQDISHPDVIEVWIGHENAMRLATSILDLIAKFKGQQ